MKPNEIVQALRHCATEADCMHCIMQKDKCNVDDLKFAAAELIEQQQAEIDQLQARLKNSVELPCEIGSTVFEDFGKKVFLTEAEAEQALAERKGKQWID